MLFRRQEMKKIPFIRNYRVEIENLRFFMIFVSAIYL